MKVVDRLKFVATWALCLWALSSCSMEYPVGGGPHPDYRTTRLAIRLPNHDLPTRAVATDFETIENLNIFIASGDDIIHSLYLDIDNFVNPLEDNGGEVIFERDGEGGSVIYSGEWLLNEHIVSRQSNFIVVANHGEAISGVASVEELRQMQDVGSSGYVNNDRRIMFGESGMNNDTKKSVKLKRTAAMITVAIDGTNLNSGIEITPLSISLHNVPSYCLIGMDNVITTEPFGTTPKAGAIFASGDSRSSLSWATVRTGVVSGGHYPEIGDEEYDYSAQNVEPLFMYENYHGGDAFGHDGATEVDKRPAACQSNDQSQIDQYTAACSYLRVTARYLSAGQQGDVTYRVFLGADEIRNFDVMRNHYYRVTLFLRNTGIGEGNTSWRLDADLSNRGGTDLTETDFSFNGNGEQVVTLEVDAAGQATSKYSIQYDTNGDGNPEGMNVNGWSNADNTPFVYIHTTNNQGVPISWELLPATQGELPNRIGRETGSQNRREFNLYIAPMIPGVTWNGVDVVRHVTFRLQGSTGGALATDWVTVTQYAPIAIPLNQYTSNANIVAKVAELGWSMSGTLYLDRIDSQDSQWGFETVQINTNGGSGIQNGDNLMVTHATVADDYLPYGYGSAMMDAAFAKYYQRNGTGNTGTGLGAMLDNPTITNIRSYVPPTNYPQNFFIPSVAEWELLDMLHTANENLFEDQTYQIGLYNRYWTSDANTASGSRESYTYMMNGRAYVGTAASRSRTTPTPYRKIYYKAP